MQKSPKKSEKGAFKFPTKAVAVRFPEKYVPQKYLSSTSLKNVLNFAKNELLLRILLKGCDDRWNICITEKFFVEHLIL